MPFSPNICVGPNNLSISNTVIFKLTTEFDEVKEYAHPPAGSGTMHTKSVRRNRTPTNAPPAVEIGVRCNR